MAAGTEEVSALAPAGIARWRAAVPTPLLYAPQGPSSSPCTPPLAGSREGPPQPWHPKGGDAVSGWGPRARCPDPPPPCPPSLISSAAAPCRRAAFISTQSLSSAPCESPKALGGRCVPGSLSLGWCNHSGVCHGKAEEQDLGLLGPGSEGTSSVQAVCPLLAGPNILGFSLFFSICS